jgi:nucleotide-binding universal stress UspA family protein
MKILIPVDGSQYTKKMLAFLTTHNEIFGTGSEYTVLNVQPPLPYRAAKAAGREAVQNWHKEEADEVFDPIRKFLTKRGFLFATKMVVGEPGERIAHMAEGGKFDMVLMGSHGHGVLGNLLLGSVAQKVLAGCKVPVLLVR